jgi:hypothetical protein
MDPHQVNYEKCITDLHLDSSKQNECFYGSQGKILQLKAEVDTLKSHLNGVPSVFYNNKFDDDESLSNFYAVVTKKLHDNNASFVP